MKFIVISLTVVFTIITARADLVMQTRVIVATTVGKQTNNVTTKIHGDKIRTDSNSTRDISIIKDVNTGDMTMLMQQKKIFTKYPGAKEKENLENKKKQSDNINTADIAQPKPLDTGKSEKIAGYDAQIYSWSDTDGMTVTYWVAKDFPNYKQFHSYLTKIDKANSTSRDKDSPPEISTLPGMLVKSQTVTKRLTFTRTLISAKEEPVDASIFEIPKDYKEQALTPNK